MSIQESKAFIQRCYDNGLNAENLDLLDDFCREDFVDHAGSENREGIRKALADHRRAYGAVRFSIGDVIAEGDRVVVRSNMTFMKSEAVADTISHSQIAIYRIGEGKIADH